MSMNKLIKMSEESIKIYDYLTNTLKFVEMYEPYAATDSVYVNGETQYVTFTRFMCLVFGSISITYNASVFKTPTSYEIRGHWNVCSYFDNPDYLNMCETIDDIKRELTVSKNQYKEFIKTGYKEYLDTLNDSLNVSNMLKKL